MILHDWNNVECIEILSNIRKAATGRARVFIVEHVVPEHNVPHFSKLFDIQHDVLGHRPGENRSAISIAVGASRVETDRLQLSRKSSDGRHHRRSRMSCGGRLQ